MFLIKDYLKNIEINGTGTGSINSKNIDAQLYHTINGHKLNVRAIIDMQDIPRPALRQTPHCVVVDYNEFYTSFFLKRRINVNESKCFCFETEKELKKHIKEIEIKRDVTKIRDSLTCIGNLLKYYKVLNSHDEHIVGNIVLESIDKINKLAYVDKDISSDT